MDQGLAGSRDIKQGVAARCCFAEPRPDRNDEVRGPYSRREARSNSKANVPGIERMCVIEQILMAKRTRNGQRPMFSKALQIGTGRRIPTATAGDHNRVLG